MFGFFIGFLVAMMVVRWKFRRMRRGLSGSGWRRSFMMRRLFARLDTDPRQEREIIDAVNEFFMTTRELRSEISSMRHDVADILRSESPDGTVEDAQVDDLMDKQAGVVERMQEAFRASMERIHAVLDDVQRSQLADALERGPSQGRCGRSGGGGGGRYDQVAGYA